MDKISIGNSVKVEVNDNGDHIEFSPESGEFQLKIAEIFELLDSPPEELTKEINEDEKKNIKDIKTILEKRNEYSKLLVEKLDSAFGEECCKKVFGDITPDISLIGDFIEQVTPIIEKHMSVKREKMSKYSAKRKGARSK